MENIVPLIMDVVVMALLGATIFYAIRLSRQLKQFRDSRKGIETLMKDLSSQIDRAEAAVTGLRAGAEKTGRNLQDKINESHALKDELDVITEAAESLAKRLETLSERAASSVRTNKDVTPYPDSRITAPSARTRNDKTGSRTRSAPSPFSFAIRDPDFERGEDNDQDGLDEGGLLPGDYEDESGDMAGMSRAEQELYAALKQHKAGAGEY